MILKKKKVKRRKKVKQVAITMISLPPEEVMEKALLQGDLSNLQTEQRLSYYRSICRSLNLNPLTKPFEYITLNNKLTLYARKDCTDQLRKVHHISLKILSREIQEDIFVVTVQAQLPNGRQDEAIGCVKIGGLTGDARANAMMKAETKGKRRVTLSISGLGFFDESELESMSGMEFESNGRDETLKEQIGRATQNRLEDAKPKQPELLPPVGEDNYGDIVVHFGEKFIGKKVSELPTKVIQWLSAHYGDKWGKAATPQDRQLKEAVDIALKHQPLDGNKKTEELPKNQLCEALRTHAVALGLTEPKLMTILREQGLIEKESGLSELTIKKLRFIATPENWNTIKSLIPAPAP